MRRLRESFEECARVVAEASERLPEVLQAAVERCLGCLEGGGTILVCGNGGSAAQAQHLVAELVCRVRRDREAIPSIDLGGGLPVLTAIANDYGFERIFARQVEALARRGDLLVAISTSGDSANVIAAARAARERECAVVALTGGRGGRLAEHADVVIAVPSTAVTRVQEIHDLCIHALVEALEEALAGRRRGRAGGTASR